MSTTVKNGQDDTVTSERRGYPREPLDRAVLVFFGDKNWGRVIDINERGMRFEFAQTPELLQRMNFTMEAMGGGMPTPPGEEAVSMPFQAYGEVVWSQDFERNAGVRFEALEGRRARFRRWLSLAAASRALALQDKELHQEQALAPLPEPFEPIEFSSETPCDTSDDAPDTPLEMTKATTTEPYEELETRLVREILDAPKFPAFSENLANEKQEQGQGSNTNSRFTRAQLVGATVGLTVVAAVGGVKMFAPLWFHKGESMEEVAGHSASKGEPARADRGSAATSSGPFLVEVSDDSNHRWLLWFVDHDSKKAANLTANMSSSSMPSHSSVSASVARGSRPKPKVESAKSGPPREFKLTAPIVRRSAANDSGLNSAAAGPAIPGDLSAPLAAPMGDVLAKGSVHAPPPPLPPGGEVQAAHLLKEVPPAYPALAKSSHVEGDVTVDAFIDSTGKVTDVKVISGPTLLRQAAISAVRQWRYEPARLNGQVAATHLSVTMKFRIDQGGH
jgi:TonB family protein